MFISRQAWFYAGLIGVATLLCLAAIYLADTPFWWAIWPVTFLATMPLQAFLRSELEHRAPVGNLNTVPLTSLVGQPVLLPTVLLAFAYDAHRGGNVMHGDDWLEICLIGGLTFGLVLFFFEAVRLGKKGAAECMESPSMMGKYLVSWSVFYGVALFLVPQSSPEDGMLGFKIGVVLLGLYGVLGILDRIRGIHPYDTYPEWDAEAFEPKKAR